MRLSSNAVQEIEGQEHQLAFVRVTGAHLGHQPIKRRCPTGIDQAQLTIEDRRLRGQLAKGSTCPAAGPCIRRRRANRTGPGCVLDDLEAKAIPFRFVQPIVALGRADSCGGAGGRMNARRTGTSCQLQELSCPARVAQHPADKPRVVKIAASPYMTALSLRLTNSGRPVMALSGAKRQARLRVKPAAELLPKRRHTFRRATSAVPTVGKGRRFILEDARPERVRRWTAEASKTRPSRG